jgi:ferredoxin
VERLEHAQHHRRRERACGDETREALEEGIGLASIQHRRSLRNAGCQAAGGLRADGTIRAPRAQAPVGHEKEKMAYVIAEPCIDTKDNSCVEVCPVDCIHPTPDEPDYDGVNMLYIDPEECIDCDACVEACPVDACFAEDQLPDEWQNYIQINADYYKQAG